MRWTHHSTWQWHPWFAWYPVLIGGQFEGQWYWLEWVERRHQLIFDVDDDWWEYRLSVTDRAKSVP